MPNLGPFLIDINDVSAALSAGEDEGVSMPEPTAHLVLTVPPEIAAAWERLEPASQEYWSRMIVHGWLRYILEPPQHVTLPTVWTATAEDIMKMPMHELARFVRELERKFGQDAGEDTPHA